MKTLRVLLAGIAAVVILAAVGGCSPEKPESPPPEGPGKTEEPAVRRGTNGNVTLTLDADTQKSMGLELGELTPATVKPEVKGYGRVLDPAPLATLVAEIKSAEAAAHASQAELERLKALAAQNNASERALQAAEAAAVKDQAQVKAARLRLLGSWGQTIASRSDLPEWIEVLASLKCALVQVDLPAGAVLSAPPIAARLESLAGGSTPQNADFLGLAPASDPQLQNRGFLFLVRDNASHLVPGMTLAGFLTLPGEPQPGLRVPASAIVRLNGAAWVYLLTDSNRFERVLLALEQPLPDGWFVRGSLKAGQKVVTVGAQELLSSERAGEAEE